MDEVDAGDTNGYYVSLEYYDNLDTSLEDEYSTLDSSLENEYYSSQGLYQPLYDAINKELTEVVEGRGGGGGGGGGSSTDSSTPQNKENAPTENDHLTRKKFRPDKSSCFSDNVLYDSMNPIFKTCVEALVEKLNITASLKKKKATTAAAAAVAVAVTTATATTAVTINTAATITTNPATNPTTSPTTDWNVQFQNALELPMTTPSLEAIRADSIGKVCREFREEVLRISKIIIQEVHVDDISMKKIPPSSEVGGQAGGEKFIHNGILYKFARDWHGIYGGEWGSSKAAGCELRGLHAIAGCGLSKLRIPLCNVIDYQGWRLVAVAIVPIDNTTLVYGSADAAGE